MPTYTKIPLSGSTDFVPINVHATADPGDVVHASSATPAVVDEIYAEVVNNSLTTAYDLTMEWGANATSSLVTVRIPAGYAGKIPIVQGTPLQNGKIFKCYANVADVLFVHGYVNRRTP